MYSPIIESVVRKYTNHCIVCNADLGETNPRQLCGKTYCTNDPNDNDIHENVAENLETETSETKKVDPSLLEITEQLSLSISLGAWNKMTLFKKSSHNQSKRSIQQSSTTKTTVPIADYKQLGLTEEVIQSTGLEQLIQWASITGKKVYLIHTITNETVESRPLTTKQNNVTTQSDVTTKQNNVTTKQSDVTTKQSDVTTIQSDVMVVPLYGISTVINSYKVKLYKDRGLPSKEYNEFLESIPVSCNYLVECSFWGDKVNKISNHRRTPLRMKDHLKLELSSEKASQCALGLNKVQVEQLKMLDMENLIKYP
jgi:hypothetical protein